MGCIPPDLMPRRSIAFLWRKTNCWERVSLVERREMVEGPTLVPFIILTYDYPWIYQVYCTQWLSNFRSKCVERKYLRIFETKDIVPLSEWKHYQRDTGKPWELLRTQRRAQGFSMALDDFDCKGIDFNWQLHPDMSDTWLMSLYLLGEVCVVALRDGKEYHEAMVKWVPLAAWHYDDIEEDPPLVTDQFDNIINSQEWDRAEELATGIFTGKLGLKSLPVNEAKWTIVGARFAWLCGDSKNLANRYMPAKIGHPIYKISQGGGLLRKKESWCDSPSLPRQQERTSERDRCSDRKEQTHDKQSSLKEPTDTSDWCRYARPRRRKDRWRASDQSSSSQSSREERGHGQKWKSPGSREESTPDPSEGPQEDVMLGTAPYDLLDQDEWEATHPAPEKRRKSVEEPKGETMPSPPSSPPPPPSLHRGQPKPEESFDVYQSVPEQEAERRLLLIMQQLKEKMDTLSPYVEELRHLSVVHGPGFVSVEDSAKLLEAYILSIESLAWQRKAIIIIPPLPASLGDMPKMMTRLKPVDPQDHAAVHRNHCIAMGRILQISPLGQPPLSGNPCLWQITRSYYLCMNALFKDLCT